MLKLRFLIFGVPLIFIGLFGEQGSVRGFVFDMESESVLVGVNVMIDNTSLGAATDITGQYSIVDIPPGTYNITFEMIGYGKLKKLNVPVNPNTSTKLDVKLKKKAILGEEVVVTGNTFTKSLDATVSEMNLDFTELMNDAGSAMDVQRMMQALPSVVSGNDQNNEIIVRGGNPDENLFIIDNIEIPNPNHFGMQGDGGGPIGMIDPLFLQEIDFYAGAFPARYGGKASSVMNIKLKEGSRDAFHSTIDMGMSGIGFNFNGPLLGGKATYMIGAHKSYLDLIAVGIGMTAIPKYSNCQAKLVYNLTPSNKLIFNSIYGIDKIYIKQEEEQDASYDSRELIDYKGFTYANGVSLKSIINEDSYTLFTLSKVGKKWTTNVKEPDINTNVKELLYQQKDLHSEWTLKGDYFNRINSQNNIRAGFNLKAITFNKNEWITANTVWQYYYYQKDAPNIAIEFPGVNYDTDKYGYAKEKILYIYDDQKNKKKLNVYKPSVFFQYKYKPIEKMEINSGLRYSYFDYNDNSYLEGRLGLSYSLTPVTNINLGYGKHYQEPSFLYFTQNLDKNKALNSYYSQQYVLGLEHFFNNSFKATIEIYNKTYENLPVDRYWIEGDSIDFYDGEMLSKQSARSKGIEIFLQKKRIKNFNFTLSYSHYIAEYKDLRKKGSHWYTGDYDFRDVFTFIGGYKTDNRDRTWYKNMKAKTWWKYVDWLISPGDEFEISTRFRYSQGKPISKQYYNPYMRDWYVPYDADINTERLPAYNRLDIMITRRWIFKKSAIVSYFNFMNLYNQKNLWGYVYNGNGKKEEVTQYSFLPVGGFIWEF